MSDVTLDHFRRAAVDIGAHGDNDTLPFDVDNRFIKQSQDKLASLAYQFFCHLDDRTYYKARQSINSLSVFSERLLVPIGPAGFRITTKIHPFWNIYINGLGVAVAEKHEPQRSTNAHSYRYKSAGDGLFDRNRSWRAYREATLCDKCLQDHTTAVIQTDVSGFYEHIYHHRLENCIKDLFPENSTLPAQIDCFLSKFAAGRSFGLPVGGQCARILAEVMMSSIDRRLSEEGIVWHRYVDDFTMITESQEAAYRALAVLSHALADYGLSLNRTKTTILRAKHYVDYVKTQLGTDAESSVLREIDLHFDPYSDAADENYSQLKAQVQSLDIQTLLDKETQKGQPDTFLLVQIARTLKLHTPSMASQLCSTLLHPKHLNAFRASWSTIMRGIARVRADNANEAIFYSLDDTLDEVPKHSRNLLIPEANCLHYLKTIRFRRTEKRAQYVSETYDRANSETVRRACIECWRHWGDRSRFNQLRNQWQNLGAEAQRMVWLAAGDFGDEGQHARRQLRAQVGQDWRLGIERAGMKSFQQLYVDWCDHDR